MSETSSSIPLLPSPIPSLTIAPALTEPRRYLGLWLPFLSTDRACRALNRPRSSAADEPPFVLTQKERGALRIAALDPLARRYKLVLDMTLAEARALVPNLMTAAMDHAADADYLLAAAAVCEKFTPLVALRGREGLILDITGCAHLFDGEEALLIQARRSLNRLGLATRAALANTPDAAWAFARFSSTERLPPTTEEKAARALPVAALEQEGHITLALTRAGLRTLGDLADRPSSVLAARFGAGLVDILRRILGREDIRITPLRPPPEIMADKHFATPITAMDGLLADLARLAGDVMGLLERRGAGGRGFEVIFFRADGAVRRLTIETAQAMRDGARLMRLIALKITTLADPLDPGFGFDALRLAVTWGETLDERQHHLSGGQVADEEKRGLADLVDRLVARFGRDHVQRFVARATHDPGEAGGVVPYLSPASSAPWPPPEPGHPPLRPLTLFERPQLIEALAEVPDSPPRRFRWRRQLHEVALAEGPERIAPEWWHSPIAGGDQPPAIRDYYRVEDARGQRFWIFREGLYDNSTTHPRWFLHGLFA